MRRMLLCHAVRSRTAVMSPRVMSAIDTGTRTCAARNERRSRAATTMNVPHRLMQTYYCSETARVLRCCPAVPLRRERNLFRRDENSAAGRGSFAERTMSGEKALKLLFRGSTRARARDERANRIGSEVAFRAGERVFVIWIPIRNCKRLAFRVVGELAAPVEPVHDDGPVGWRLLAY